MGEFVARGVAAVAIMNLLAVIIMVPMSFLAASFAFKLIRKMDKWISPKRDCNE